MASGRWFLSVACAPSSFFDLPWVTGLFSLVYISLTAAVVVRLLGIKDPVAVVLGGALIASYPGMTETFFYGFTADGYFLAMLLSALAVLLSAFECKNRGSGLSRRCFCAWRAGYIRHMFRSHWS